MRGIVRHKKMTLRNTEEEWGVAYKRSAVPVAVSRKKKVALDAFSNVVKGMFS
jgi:hypothetical protein